jgi:hypothetical protein
MSRTKPNDSSDTRSVSVVEPVQDSLSVGPARVFRDTLYTSRYLVMPDGRTLPVAGGRITADGDEQYAFLSAHPDLEPASE